MYLTRAISLIVSVESISLLPLESLRAPSLGKQSASSQNFWRVVAFGIKSHPMAEELKPVDIQGTSAFQSLDLVA
ncbi:hypothetical protein NPIL_172911 [Nephila pilipes]|uniref:Uncharacterized protein n=1 Tax=Nephila pilipes TaxID=299642 RepID=A0A8X6NTP1_NEPPI|nr:hypothetical protein NPIL_172911 [Nephila pilipes]